MSRNRRLSFYKMQSLGNDFMVLDGVSRDAQLEPKSIAKLADRHTGIGFDQLLIITPPTKPHVDFGFTIYNADGSEAQQCGNGTRCVMLLARHLKLTKKDTVVWESLAGEFETRREGDAFTTQMTVPVLEPDAIPIDPAALEAADDGVSFRTQEQDHFTPVSMGNPHAVVFTDDLFAIDVDAEGGRLTEHAAFPQRANIGFCQVIDRQFMRLRVYERGTGETLACGSGACAAVVAARLRELVDERVKVSLPGGKLRIGWAGRGDPVTMSGPATLVYEGEVRLP